MIAKAEEYYCDSDHFHWLTASYRFSDIKIRASEKTVSHILLFFSVFVRDTILAHLGSKQTAYTQWYSLWDIKTGEKFRQGVFIDSGRSACRHIHEHLWLLLKAVLGGISLSNAEYKSADSHPQLEALGIYRHVARIARGVWSYNTWYPAFTHFSAVVEVGVVKAFGSQVKHGLEL